VVRVDDFDMKLGQECFIVRDGNGQALAYGAHSFGVHLHPDNAAIG
jgi:hypothetical protein